MFLANLLNIFAWIQILLSLPCITQQDFLAFQEALSKTSSPKEQKQHMKSFLLLATGNQLKALASQKSATVISNVSGKITLHIGSFSICFGSKSS